MFLGSDGCPSAAQAQLLARSGRANGMEPPGPLFDVQLGEVGALGRTARLASVANSPGRRRPACCAVAIRRRPAPIHWANREQDSQLQWNACTHATEVRRPARAPLRLPEQLSADAPRTASRLPPVPADPLTVDIIEVRGLLQLNAGQLTGEPPVRSDLLIAAELPRHASDASRRNYRFRRWPRPLLALATVLFRCPSTPEPDSLRCHGSPNHAHSQPTAPPRSTRWPHDHTGNGLFTTESAFGVCSRRLREDTVRRSVPGSGSPVLLRVVAPADGAARPQIQPLRRVTSTSPHDRMPRPPGWDPNAIPAGEGLATRDIYSPAKYFAAVRR